jgi:hypothetical protein
VGLDQVLGRRDLGWQLLGGGGRAFEGGRQLTARWGCWPGWARRPALVVAGGATRAGGNAACRRLAVELRGQPLDTALAFATPGTVTFRRLRLPDVLGHQLLERVQPLVQLVGGYRLSGFARPNDPRCRVKCGTPRCLVRTLALISMLGRTGPPCCCDPVEVDVAKAAPFLLVECQHCALAFVALRLLANLGPEGRVLVSLLVPKNVTRRSGPCRDLFDLAHLDFAFHIYEYPSGRHPTRTAPDYEAGLATTGALDRDRGLATHPPRDQLAADRTRIIPARCRNIGAGPPARRLLTPVFYGLRDGQIRALAAGGRVSESDPARRGRAVPLTPASLSRGRPLD